MAETEALQGGDSEMEKVAETEADEVEEDEVEADEVEADEVEEENSKNDEEPEKEVEKDKNSKNDDSNPLHIVETDETVNETVDHDKLNLGNINLFSSSLILN